MSLTPAPTRWRRTKIVLTILAAILSAPFIMVALFAGERR